MSEDIYKIILIGDSGVGKTSLIYQFIKNEMPEDDYTIGGSFFKKKIVANNRNINFDIWDTAGQERFRSLVRMFYRGTNGCICVFDLSNRISFNSLNFWISDYINNTDTHKKILLVANKCDIDISKWQVSQDEIIDLCNRYNCQYIYASCIKKQNINEIFLKISELLINTNCPIKQFQIETKNKINIEPKVNPIEEPVLCSC